ncbi:hypothetical protein IMZ48_21310 [Candidatus Bathyarchaeota archaeon]|nr:hypothetical protein [Candidatus Bathyarchaeota archaeon]
MQCLPISANWDPVAKATATCVDDSFHITISSLTIFTDILVVALPLWIVWGLKMRPAVKFAVMIVFLLGLGYVPLFVACSRIMY